MRPPAPHILLLVTDQHRWDAFGGLEPSGQLRTPNFDRLFEGGARFDRHYTSTPSCTPARAALLTGRSPWRHGELGYGSIARDYAPYVELPKALAAAGYRPVAVGKNHFCDGEAACDAPHGFEEVHLYDGLETELDEYRAWFNATSGGLDPMATAPAWDAARPLTMNDWRGAAYAYDESWHPTAWTARVAAEVVRNHSDDAARPLFLKLSFHRPHSPYDPPARLLDAFDAAALAAPAAAADGWDRGGRGVCAAAALNWTAAANATAVPTDVWCGAVRDADARASRAAYLASVAFVDEGLGVVLDALDARGWLEETFVVYTADHGDALGDHFLWRKTYPYEASARVPLLVRPGAALASRRALRAGSVVDATHVTEVRDVLPTLLDAAGALALVPADQPLDGASLLPLLAAGAEPPPWRAWIDLEHAQCYNASNHWSALASVSRKYVFHARTGVEQLFDLAADPGETVDLGRNGSYADELALWRARLVAQFEAEGRGAQFVDANGTLVWPRENVLYSPYYPAGR